MTEIKEPHRDDGAGVPTGEAVTPEALEHSRADALAPYEAADATREVSSRVSRNIRWNFAGQLWTFVITLVATPITIHHLGADAYGIIAALAIVTNYMAFLDLGVSQASIKYVAEYRSQDRWDQIRHVFWTSTCLYLLLGFLAAALVLAFSPAAARGWFLIPQALQAPAVAAFWVGAAGVFLVLLNFAPTSLIKGLERFDLSNKVGIALGTIQPLLTLVLVLSGASLALIVAGNAAALAGAVAVNFMLSKRLVPGLGAPIWDRDILVRLVRFGGYLAAASVLAPLAVSAEKFLLAGSVSIAALTYYMVPQSVIARLAIIPASFSSALFPAFTALHTSGKTRRSTALNAEVARTLVYLFAPVLIVLLLGGEALLTLWMGADFARQSGTVLQVLSIAAFVQALAWTPHVLIQALGRSDITFRVYLYQVILYLPAAYVLVVTWGLVGAAAAWLVRVALDSALVWYFGYKLAGISLLDIVSDRTAGVVLFGMLMMSVGSLVAREFASLWTVVAVAGALMTAFYAWRPLVVTLHRLAAGDITARWAAT